MMRQEAIQYSSRTRAVSDYFKHTQKIRSALASLMKRLPSEAGMGPNDCCALIFSCL